jgi:hypothetical protein
MPGPMPPIPNVVQVLLRGTTPGEKWENVLYFQYSGGPPTGPNLASLASTVSGWWANQMAPECPSPIALTSVVATDMASNTGAQGIYTATTPGTRGDDVMGSNSSVLISYPVPLRFKGGHFRQYLLAGGNADNQDGMSWHAAFVTEIQTHWNAFLAAINGTTVGTTSISAHVAVRRHGKYLPNGGPPHYVLNNPIVIAIPVSTGVAHAQMASQKGRIGRRSK